MKFAAHTLDITPHIPETTVYSEAAVYERIATPLKMSGLWIETEDKLVLICTADCFFVPLELKSLAYKLMAQYAKGRSYEVFFFASHAHHVPNLDITKVHFKVASGEYLLRLSVQLRQLVNQLNQHKQEAGSLAYGSASTGELSINRRKRWIGKAVLGLQWDYKFKPNPKGPKDEQMGILKLSYENGNPAAYLINWACHPVCYPDKQALSADFPHFLRQQIREKEADVPVLFINGFTGNVRPHIQTGIRLKRFWEGRQFRPASVDSYAQWIAALRGKVEEAHQNLKALSLKKELQLYHEAILLADFIDQNHRQKFKLKSLRMGPFQLFSASAEMMAEHALYLRQHAHAPALMLGGYEGFTFGYYPTDAIIEQGGYEAYGYFPYFGFNGKFTSSLDKQLEQIWTNWI